jgi:hypothetical protein
MKHQSGESHDVWKNAVHSAGRPFSAFFRNSGQGCRFRLDTKFTCPRRSGCFRLRSSLATRFNIGDVQINAVLSQVDRLGDAYMVLRLREMSRQPLDVVIAKYRTEKSHGWGVLAKSLGIKPGSREFHALKRGNDLYDGKGNSNQKKTHKEKGKKRK